MYECAEIIILENENIINELLKIYNKKETKNKYNNLNAIKNENIQNYILILKKYLHVASLQDV